MSGRFIELLNGSNTDPSYGMNSAVSIFRKIAQVTFSGCYFKRHLNIVKSGIYQTLKVLNRSLPRILKPFANTFPSVLILKIRNAVIFLPYLQ